MANHKSAKKRARQDIRKNKINHNYIAGVRTAVKSFRAAAQDLIDGVQADEKVVQGLFHKAQSKLMKAATKGVLHKNNASRRVSRLDAVLTNSVKAKGTGTAPKVKKK